jgi:lincosamide nucleotidyltransferase A/C/D/E
MRLAATRRSATAAARRILRALYRALSSPRSPLSPLLRGSLVERARQRANTTVVTAQDVVEVLERLREGDVRAWLIGGWAVDALLGHETRSHGDLDLVVEADRLASGREILERAGFRFAHEAPAGRWLSVQVQMIDGPRRSVSLHPIDVRAWSAPAGADSMRQGARELGLGEVEDLFVSGRIAGREVPSLSAAAQVTLHCGYEIRDRDRRDVAALCRQFDLPLPPRYRDSGAEVALEGCSDR